MSTARDFSVMPVLILPDERVSLARAVRTRGGSTRAGEYVDVEIGATWATRGDVVKERVGGIWHQCLVLRHDGGTVHVRLSPSGKAAPPAFG